MCICRKCCILFGKIFCNFFLVITASRMFGFFLRLLVWNFFLKNNYNLQLKYTYMLILVSIIGWMYRVGAKSDVRGQFPRLCWGSLGEPLSCYHLYPPPERVVARAEGVKNSVNWVRRVTVRVLCSDRILQWVVSFLRTSKCAIIAAEHNYMAIFFSFPLFQRLFFFFELKSFCLEQVELI